MGENDVKIFAAFVNDGGEADDFRARADDDEQLELAVVLELNVVVVRFHCKCFPRILRITRNVIFLRSRLLCSKLNFGFRRC